MKIKKIGIIAILIAMFFSVEVKAYQNDFSKLSNNENSYSISKGGTIKYRSFKIDESYHKYAIVGIPVSLYKKEDNSFVDRQYIADDKYATFNNLEPGIYYVVEDVDNSNYLPLEIHYIEINSEKDVKTYDAHYQYQTLELTFNVNVQNYKFEDNEIKYYYVGKYSVLFGVYDENDTLLRIVSSDEDGKVFYSAPLAPGRYYFQQFNSLDGYIKDTTKHYFEFARIGEENVQHLDNQFEINLNLLKSYVNIQINDYYTTKPTEGLKLEFFNKNYEKIMELTSASNGKILTYLPYGLYYIKKPVTLFDYSEKNQYIPLNLTIDYKAVNIINKDPLNDPNNSIDDETNNGLDDSKNNEEESNEDEQDDKNNEPSPDNGTLTGPKEEQEFENNNSNNTNNTEKEVEENNNNSLKEENLLDNNENESSLNNLLNQEKESNFEPIEVELGATDQTILSYLFYITSALGLFIIKYVK